MAKWREESGKTIKDAEESEETATTQPVARPTSDDEETPRRGSRRRPRDGDGVRGGVRRVSDLVANAVRIVAMIICVLLALHIAFVVFRANDGNVIVRRVNVWADWFAWRFRDIFVPKDERVGVLVNYGIAAIVYLIVGRVVAGLIRRIR
jgi:hypothetical protein